MSTKFHMYGRCKTLRKHSFFTKGYAENHIQRPFFEIRKDMQNGCIQDPNGAYMLLVLVLHVKNFFSTKYENLNLW